MRKSLRASVLVLALAFSAHAGETQTPPGETQTPPLLSIVLALLGLL